METFISNFCFISLFITMLFYWIKLTLKILSKNWTFGSLIISNLLLFFHLTLRWYNSHHFPVSNL